MKKVFQVINNLEEKGIIKGYAVGGATALLFYAEPALTFDVDIFIFLPGDTGAGKLVDLGPLYNFLKSKGYHAEKEYVLIEGIPVQFIPVYNALLNEAVERATTKEYEGIEVKIVSLEHLFAIMIDTNRPKDRERIGKLLGELHFNRKKLESILERYSLTQKWRKQVGKK